MGIDPNTTSPFELAQELTTARQRIVDAVNVGPGDEVVSDAEFTDLLLDVVVTTLEATEALTAMLVTLSDRVSPVLIDLGERVAALEAGPGLRGQASE